MEFRELLRCCPEVISAASVATWSVQDDRLGGLTGALHLGLEGDCLLDDPSEDQRANAGGGGQQSSSVCSGRCTT